MQNDPHALLHRLWTKAVGTLGYDKSEWGALEEILLRLAPPTASVMSIGIMARTVIHLQVRGADALEEFMEIHGENGANALYREAAQIANDPSHPEGARIFCRSLMESADKARMGDSPEKILKNLFDRE